MNYEKSWNQLKADLVKQAGEIKYAPDTRETFKQVLFHMSRIETQNTEQEENQGNQERTISQDITGNVEYKAPNIAKLLARKSFEQITGYKVIYSLEKLENEIQKRKGRAPFSEQEPIVVDEKVKIPEHIQREAMIRGIRIARFGVEVMFPGGFRDSIVGVK